MAKQLLFGESGSGGGGIDTGVMLWENPNPAATFSGQAVELSAPITQFDFIGIIMRGGTQDANNELSETIYRVEDFMKFNYGNSPSGNRANCASFSAWSGSVQICRCSKPNDETHINFSNANNLGTGATVNSYDIPQYIIGY